LLPGVRFLQLALEKKYLPLRRKFFTPMAVFMAFAKSQLSALMFPKEKEKKTFSLGKFVHKVAFLSLFLFGLLSCLAEF
jgi:hypothetical protein